MAEGRIKFSFLFVFANKYSLSWEIVEFDRSKIVLAPSSQESKDSKGVFDIFTSALMLKCEQPKSSSRIPVCVMCWGHVFNDNKQAEMKKKFDKKKIIQIFILKLLKSIKF